MIDWTKPMKQYYRFFQVDPYTLSEVRELTTITTSKVTHDISTQTIFTANLTSTEDLKEIYVRIYLVAEQKNYKERFALATVLLQPSESKYNGKNHEYSFNANSPIQELVDAKTPIGYTIRKSLKLNLFETLYELTMENVRSRVIKPEGTKLIEENIVASGQPWIETLTKLSGYANRFVDCDSYGNIMFSDIKLNRNLKPVWTFDDGNSSILYPEVTDKMDIYSVPNILTVVYSDAKATRSYTIKNDDPLSKVSTVVRGREITMYDTSPKFNAVPSEVELREYTENKMNELRTITRTISISHGYCEAKSGDCVMLNYESAGIVGVKARINRQIIECKTGCKVQSTLTCEVTL